jgi:tripartite-type tricarboxylate transporter receptor subunit TctC
MMRLFIVAVATLLGISAGTAQNYPTRPVTLIVPFAPGGLTDAIARVLVEGMREPLGQNLIIENIGGASGTIGAGRVARAAPDGYTLMLGIWNTQVANGAIFQSLDFDVVKSFEPISLVGDAPMVYLAKKGMPANNLKDFVAWLKANPNKATTGTAGSGAPSTLLHTLFKKQTETQFEIIGYRGAGLIPQDLLSGQIDMAILNTATSLPHVKTGAVKAYAVTSPKRLTLAPDIPTMAEAGYPGLEFSIWAGLYAPKGTPKEIVDKVNQAVISALENPQIRERLINQGVEIFPKDMQNPAALAAFQKKDIERWWPIIKEAGIKAQ